jgi:hypothetical protein
VSVVWLAPLALTGLALVALPILIHLLARHRSRRLLFPTLRFLPTSQLAALRRRSIADWPLLVVRVLIITAAVIAAAAPVFVSAARRAAWDARVARAIVVSANTPEIEALADEEARTSFASARISEARLPDAIRSAATWLAAQPPASREVVVIGDLREGALASSDLDVIPSQVGVRFLPVGARDLTSGEVAAVADADGQVAGSQITIEPDSRRTRVAYVGSDDRLSTQVRVIAAPSQQPYADAMLRAVLREGVLFEPSVSRSLTLAFEGAPAPVVEGETPAEWMTRVLERHPEVRGGASDGALVLRASMPVTDTRALALLSGVLRTAFAPPMTQWEPRPLSPATLAQWTRPSGASPDDVLPADEGDRRWLWGAALLLLGVEQVMRRRGRLHA